MHHGELSLLPTAALLCSGCCCVVALKIGPQSKNVCHEKWLLVMCTQFINNLVKQSHSNTHNVHIAPLFHIRSSAKSVFPMHITALSGQDISHADSHSYQRGEDNQDNGQQQMPTHPTVTLLRLSCSITLSPVSSPLQGGAHSGDWVSAQGLRSGTLVVGEQICDPCGCTG